MTDNTAVQPDYPTLQALASEQAGYFTARQARSAGYSWSLLSHHAGTGLLRRVSRGVYRLRDFPSSTHEELVAAQLRLGPEAIISHESALDVFDLSDVIPDVIHVTVPRSHRGIRSSPGVLAHTVKESLSPTEIVRRGPIRVTSPARTIADVAATGMSSDQVALAIRQAMTRGLVTRPVLKSAARQSSRRARAVIEGALVAP